MVENLKREAIDIIIDMLDVLKWLGKLKKNIVAYDRKSLSPLIKEAETKEEPAQKFRGYLQIINAFITVHISEFVGDNSTRGDFNIALDRANIQYATNCFRLKRLYEELRNSVDDAE